MDLKKVLPLFSYVFHPIFISLYGTLFYFIVSQTYIYESQVLLTLIQVGILTLFLPISLYYLFISLGIVASFTEASLKERKLPLMTQAILLFLLLKFSTSLNALPELFYFFLGGFSSSILAFICVLLRFKASLHMIGICSLGTFVYGLSIHLELPLVNTIAFSVMCIGFVASSRLYMKSHTPIELIVGGFIGVLSQVIFWYFWL
ncbi:hypothetical protein SY27_09935 [Flavobacterium sp. 316]|uniref:hypothetical protein n=1 Tax=Flavobacterium sp. 316 TaxID=1603293 RepID=UPI0005DEE7A0|nr:hypothetical protein [Flavobacterium sp. 316]KIX21081.1 hypothetical protein SY27_09935 [Flavobacterium sp. 316]